MVINSTIGGGTVTLLMREVVAITAAVDQGVAYIGVAPLCEPTYL